MLERGRWVGGFEGVTGRRGGTSKAARLMNCKGASGDPDEGEDFTECGLWAPGVERMNDGIEGPWGSGVRGGGDVMISGASSNVAELIQFSSRDPNRGEPNREGVSGGMMRNISAKWPFMNLCIL